MIRFDSSVCLALPIDFARSNIPYSRVEMFAVAVFPCRLIAPTAQAQKRQTIRDLLAVEDVQTTCRDVPGRVVQLTFDLPLVLVVAAVEAIGDELEETSEPATERHTWCSMPIENDRQSHDEKDELHDDANQAGNAAVYR